MFCSTTNTTNANKKHKTYSRKNTDNSIYDYYNNIIELTCKSLLIFNFKPWALVIALHFWFQQERSILWTVVGLHCHNLNASMLNRYVNLVYWNINIHVEVGGVDESKMIYSSDCIVVSYCLPHISIGQIINSISIGSIVNVKKSKGRIICLGLVEFQNRPTDRSDICGVSYIRTNLDYNFIPICIIVQQQ